jgi:hypothetical protein
MENKVQRKIAVMQPYLFPYLGYFQLIASVDKFVFYDDVNYINKGWVNRNNLLVNKQAHLFTIPLSEASQNKLIRETKISPEKAWKIKLLKTIETAYRKAPHFDVVFLMISKWIAEPPEFISDLNVLSTKEICEYLEIPTEIESSSSVYNNSELKGQHRILDICRKENATAYINPIGGMSIYDNSLFREKNIELFFLKTIFTPYKQYGNEFVQGLSIIDYLMFLSPEEIKDKLKEFTFVTNA